MKAKILSEQEITQELQNVAGWKYHDNKISKEFTFNDFMDSLKFVNHLALIFEARDHHADTHIMYSKIIFDLQRFDVGGKVTDMDIAMAKIINEQYAKYHPHNEMV